METYNALGFTNFWSVTPAYNILNNEERVGKAYLFRK
jgi:hypothetical protein